MLTLMEAGIVLGLAVGVVAGFARWEREGKEHLAPLVLLGLLVVEATIYGNENAVPRGLFHPGTGSIQVRLPELYITLALVARLIARGKPKRIGFPALLWLTFGAWLVVGAVEGHLYHNQGTQILYETEVVVYIVGGYALAAGVPVRRYLETTTLFRLGALCVACASILDLMTIGGISVSTNLPLLPLQGFGADGDSAATIFVAIGTMCFLPILAAGKARPRHVLAVVPVVASVVLAGQRAVLGNLGMVVLVVVIVLLVEHRHGVTRRVRVGAGHVVVIVLATAAVFLVVAVVPAAVDRQPVQVPLAANFQSLFHGGSKAESAQDRLNLAAEAETLIPQHLFIGWGLGVELQYFEAGTRTVQTIPYAHDIVLDLWLRVGLIGLVLFLAAMAASVTGGLRAWRRHPDAMTAALALALVAVVAGLMVTALLEPLLDEYRFAVLLGISLGMLRAVVTSTVPKPGVPVWGSKVDRLQVEAGGSMWT